MARSEVLGEGSAAALAVPARPRRRFALPRGDMLVALLALSPSLLAVAIFIYGFILWTGYISLVNWNDALPTYVFVGLPSSVCGPKDALVERTNSSAASMFGRGGHLPT